MWDGSLVAGTPLPSGSGVETHRGGLLGVTNILGGQQTEYSRSHPPCRGDWMDLKDGTGHHAVRCTWWGIRPTTTTARTITASHLPNQKQAQSRPRAIGPAPIAAALLLPSIPSFGCNSEPASTRKSTYLLLRKHRASKKHQS